MNIKEIQIKRGLKTAVDSEILLRGEPAVAMNTKELFIGEDDTSNKIKITDVEFYTAKVNFPQTGIVGKLYIDKSTVISYLWDEINSIYYTTPISSDSLEGDLPAISVSRSTELNAYNVWTQCNFDREDVPTNNIDYLEYDNTKNAILIKQSGLYQLSIHFMVKAGYLSDTEIRLIRRNGSDMIIIDTMSFLVHTYQDEIHDQGVTRPYFLYSGDEVTMEFKCANSGTRIKSDASLSIIRLIAMRGPSGPPGQNAGDTLATAVRSLNANMLSIGTYWTQIIFGSTPYFQNNTDVLECSPTDYGNIDVKETNLYRLEWHLSNFADALLNNNEQIAGQILVNNVAIPMTQQEFSGYGLATINKGESVRLELKSNKNINLTSFIFLTVTKMTGAQGEKGDKGDTALGSVLIKQGDTSTVYAAETIELGLGLTANDLGNGIIEIAMSANSTGKDDIQLGFGSNVANYFRIRSTNWAVIRKLIFKGSDTSGHPTKVSLCCYVKDTSKPCNFRIYDETNSQVICEIDNIDNSNTDIISSTNISNVSTDPAIWSIEGKDSNNKKELRVYSLLIEF